MIVLSHVALLDSTVHKVAIGTIAVFQVLANRDEYGTGHRKRPHVLLALFYSGPAVTNYFATDRALRRDLLNKAAACLRSFCVFINGRRSPTFQISLVFCS